MINKLRTFAGPVVTLIVLLAIYWLPGLAVTAVLAFVPLVWTVYTEGRGRGLVSAGIIIAYAFYVYPPDYSRIIQIAFASIVIVLMVNELKLRARLSETINGNMKRLKEIVELTRKLEVEWCDLSDAGRYKLVVQIEDRLGNLAALVFGWMSIGAQMKQVKAAVGMESEAVTEEEEGE